MDTDPCRTTIGAAARRAAWIPVLLLAAAAAWAGPEAQPERGQLAMAAEPAPARSARGRASDLVLAAMNFMGVPYRRGGGHFADGFDCSGFTRHIFELSLGLVLPRRVDEQASASGLVSVERSDLRAGDLVFFNTLQRTFSHVGIYIGEGRFIHAPRSGSEVRIDDMRYAYWTQRFTGARRALAVQAEGDGGQPPALPRLP